METVFGTSFEYKLIYVFAINDEAHKSGSGKLRYSKEKDKKLYQQRMV